MTTAAIAAPRAARHAFSLVLRVLVAMSLAVDAVVHLRLAGGYQQSAPSGIGAGNLFRIEAGVALVVAAWVLWRGSRSALLAAFAVGLSAALAVVLYRYVNVPTLGPLPAMYEPVWFFEKALSAVFEGVAAVAALAALALIPRQRGSHVPSGDAAAAN